MAGKLYVGNLPFTTEREALVKHFEPHGKVVYAKIVRTKTDDGTKGDSRGFGFVEMENHEVAMKALDGVKLDGRPLTVKLAVERDKKKADPKEEERASDESAKGEEQPASDTENSESVSEKEAEPAAV